MRSPAFGYNTPVKEVPKPRLYVWFGGEEDEKELNLEWHGGYQKNAVWYRPFWRRLRVELNSVDAESLQGWSQVEGGMANNVWSLPLGSAALRTPQTPQMALAAVQRAVKAFNEPYPHNVGIVLEVI